MNSVRHYTTVGDYSYIIEFTYRLKALSRNYELLLLKQHPTWLGNILCEEWLSFEHRLAHSQPGNIRLLIDTLVNRLS